MFVVDEIVVDSEKVYEELKAAFPHVVEENPKLFKLYNHTENIVYAYNLNSQIDSILQKKVEMSNGAYLVIDRTEALTVIDVNTGKYVGQKQLSETIFETNKIAGSPRIVTVSAQVGTPQYINWEATKANNYEIIYVS